MQVCDHYADRYGINGMNNIIMMYNHGHSYDPDFVVETEGVIYLVEVKGEDKLNDPDVIAKKKRGIQYCEVATRWGL